ncbi:hypothetical protein ACU610_08265 [Geodermatophilus sp. URMC 61]|uniref:hypothetical protein n=1 Tax=Geodermatophilus sp. URMC 61 TaxID=3423411 RepID=UPI00406C26F7
MSVRSQILAAAAATTTIVGAGTVAPPLASAATPACGPGCIAVFSPEFGTHGDPQFVEAVLDGVGTVGQPLVLQRASSSDPSEDFLPRGGLVSDFFATGMVSAAVNGHYGSLRAAQLEYAPSGVASGLCVGLASTAYEDEPLGLQPCSVPETTVWIVDTADSPATAAEGYSPLVNGSTTDFTHPFAMTYPADAAPTDEPAPQIHVSRLHFCEHADPAERAVPDRQLWGTLLGVLE